MELLKSILEGFSGDVHFFISFGEKPAAEVKLKDKEIILEIKNPILAAEVAIEELIQKRKKSNLLKYMEKLKDLGYKVKIKYKLLEVEL
jgi:dimeric dUTPase (all-alpha-NTP-PPase superfamily)